MHIFIPANCREGGFFGTVQLNEFVKRENLYSFVVTDGYHRQDIAVIWNRCDIVCRIISSSASRLALGGKLLRCLLLAVSHGWCGRVGANGGKCWQQEKQARREYKLLF